MVGTRVKTRGSKRAKVVRGRKTTKFRNYKYKPERGLRDLMKMTNPFLKWDFVFPENHLVQESSTPGTQGVFGPDPSTAWYDPSQPTGSNPTLIEQKQNSLLRQSLCWLTVQDLRTIYFKLVGDVSAGKLFRELYAVDTSIPQQNLYDQSDKWPTVYCHGYTHQVTMQNPNATTCYVELWTLTPRDHHDTVYGTPQHFWNQNLSQLLGPGVPDYGLNQLPSNDHKPQHQITHDINEPGARPSNQGIPCSEFWEKFFLIGKARYKLEAGSNCTHTFKVPGFKLTHDMLYKENSQEKYNCVPGLTCMTLGFLIGEKGFDDTAGAQDVVYLDAKVTMRARAYSSWSVKMWNRSNFKITTNDIFTVTNDDTNATHKIHHPGSISCVMRVDPPNVLRSSGFHSEIANADDNIHP